MQSAINPIKKNRILWIDGAKVLGIFLVILGHMSISKDIINPIFSFHMPLFFFFSGYLEKNTLLKDTIKNGIRGLITPYVLFYLLSYIWWFQVSLVRHPEIYGTVSLESAIIKPILGMIMGVGYDTEFSTMLNVPIWFLIGLFVTKIIHNLVLMCSKENQKIYIGINVTIVFLVFVIKTSGIDLFFSIDSALMSLPFFSAGYFFQKGKFAFFTNFIESNKKGDNYSKVLVIITTLMLVIFLSNYNGRIDTNEYIYGKSLLLFYINAFLGIVLIVSIATFYRIQNNIISIISNGTIIILAFHVYLFETLCKIIGMKGVGIIINPVVAILVALATLLLMIIPIKIIEKYFPILLGKKRKLAVSTP